MTERPRKRRRIAPVSPEQKLVHEEPAISPDEKFERLPPPTIRFRPSPGAPSKTDLPNTDAPVVQQDTGLRMDILENIQFYLFNLRTYNCNLERFINVEKRLAGGTYGTVFVGRIKQYPQIRLAIKEIVRPPKKPSDEFVRDIYHEEYAMILVNAFVNLKICPNFPLLYQPYFCASPDNTLDVGYLLEELADGTLRDIIEQQWAKRSNAITIVHNVFQLVVAVACQYYFLSVVNNDLTTNNILYNRLAQRDSYFEYRVFGESYYIYTSGILLKIIDYGLATGRLIDRPHESYPYVYSDEKVNTELKTWDDLSLRHIHHLFLRAPGGNPIHPAAMDFWTIFMNIALAGPGLPQGCEAWAKYGMRRAAGNRQCNQAFQYLTHMFSRSTLERFFPDIDIYSTLRTPPPDHTSILQTFHIAMTIPRRTMQAIHDFVGTRAFIPEHISKVQAAQAPETATSSSTTTTTTTASTSTYI